MEDERINIQLIQSAWTESRASTLHASSSHTVPTDWISCMYLALFPRLPFCKLIYIQFLHLHMHCVSIFQEPGCDTAFIYAWRSPVPETRYKITVYHRKKLPNRSFFALYILYCFLTQGITSNNFTHHNHCTLSTFSHFFSTGID